MQTTLDIMRKRIETRYIPGGEIEMKVDQWGTCQFTVSARSGAYCVRQYFEGDLSIGELDAILDSVEKDLFEKIQAAIDEEKERVKLAERSREKQRSAIACCDDFDDALEDGTDPEGYGPAICCEPFDAGVNGSPNHAPGISMNLMIGSGGLPPIRFCPWCGAKKSTGEETNADE